MHFMAVKEKTFLVLRFIQIKKTAHLQQLKEIQSSKLGNVKGVPFVNRIKEYERGTLSVTKVNKMVRGWTSENPRIKLC